MEELRNIKTAHESVAADYARLTELFAAARAESESEAATLRGRLAAAERERDAMAADVEAMTQKYVAAVESQAAVKQRSDRVATKLRTAGAFFSSFFLFVLVGVLAWCAGWTPRVPCVPLSLLFSSHHLFTLAPSPV